MKKPLFAATLLAICAMMSSGAALAQTTDPEVNRLLSEANRQVAGAKQDISSIMQKDRMLREACWQHNEVACQSLDQMLVNPNLDPQGVYVEPPPGAFWPFQRH